MKSNNVNKVNFVIFFLSLRRGYLNLRFIYIYGQKNYWTNLVSIMYILIDENKTKNTTDIDIVGSK